MKLKHFKYFIIFILGTLLIVFSSIFLRKITIDYLIYHPITNINYQEKIHTFSKKTTKNSIFLQKNATFLNNYKNFSFLGYAAEDNYLLITEDTSLYKTSSLSEADKLITLPKTYYCEKLTQNSSGIVKVNYNGITGFTLVSATTPCTNPAGSLYQTANATTSADAGTYLRQEPNTTSNKLALIPASSTLSYIGYIAGETPSDGTNNLWYLVDYEVGPTTTHRGYVYSERVILDKMLAPQALPEDNSNSQTTNAASVSNIAPEDLTGTISLSSGVKWFLIILFSTLAIIIFALLLISPKRDNKKSDLPPQDEIETRPPDALAQNSERKKTKTAYQTSKIIEPKETRKNNRLKKQTSTEHARSFNLAEDRPYPRIKQNFGKTTNHPNSDLPPFISRYFNVSSPDFDSDDEPL